MLDERIIRFYQQLKIEAALPKHINVLNPYLDSYTVGLCKKFYGKYYHDDNKRRLMLGINPGRFGSGTTGISFTDPIKLEKICGIENTLIKKPELSADFIYKMIEGFGGLESFYQQYFISSVCPLGFTSEGKNINYYDDKNLEVAITPFVANSINKLLGMGIENKTCFCIGEGKNSDFLKKLNAKHQWFQEIVPLPHPRFIMQYKRKRVNEYVDLYLNSLIL